MSIVAPERDKTSRETLENAVQQHTSGEENSTHNHACRKSAQLDSLLFTAPYFLIDAENHKTSDMLTTRPAHTQQPIVGTLHPNVVAIDFDLDTEEETDWALHHLITWCEDRSTWYAHRASGGGPGRVHFLALPRKEHRDELASYIEQLRIELGATKTQIDVRDKLRLLSSPHRHGHARGRLVTAWATPPAELLPGTPRPRQRRIPSAPAHDTADQLTERQHAENPRRECVAEKRKARRAERQAPESRRPAHDRGCRHRSKSRDDADEQRKDHGCREGTIHATRLYQDGRARAARVSLPRPRRPRRARGDC